MKKGTSTPLAQGFLQYALLLALQGKEMTGADLHDVLLNLSSPLELSLPSVYRALGLLRKRGAVFSAKKTGNTRDIHYRITEAGRKEIWYRNREWEQLSGSISQLMGEWRKKEKQKAA